MRRITYVECKGCAFLVSFSNCIKLLLFVSLNTRPAPAGSLQWRPRTRLAHPFLLPHQPDF